MHTALLAVLGVSMFVDLALGAWASVAWGSFTTTWMPSLKPLDLEPARDARLMGLVFGLALFCFAALQGLAFRWIRSEREEGHRVVILFGIYLIVSSIITFLLFRRAEFLLIDGIRGAALTVFAVLALNAPSVVRELRLPKGEESRRTRSGQERRQTVRSRPSGPQRRGRKEEGRDSRPEKDQGRSRRRRDSTRTRAGSPSQPAAEPARTRDRLRPTVAASGEEADTRKGGRRRSRNRPSRPSRREERDEPQREQPDERAEVRYVENRSRTTDELLAQDTSVFGRRSDDLRGLAVVVRGEPTSRKARVPGDTPGSPSGGGRDEEAAGTDQRRHRRRRPRRRQEAGEPEDEGSPASVPGRSPDRTPEPESPSVPSRQDRAPAPRTSSEMDGPRDLLNLLEAKSTADPAEGEPFGRTRKPVRGRRPASPTVSGESAAPTEAETRDSTDHPRPTGDPDSAVRPRTDADDGVGRRVDQQGDPRQDRKGDAEASSPSDQA